MFHVEQFRLPQLCNNTEDVEDGPDGEDKCSGADEAQNFLPEAALPLIEEYYRLLSRWNSTYNLTAIGSPEEFVRLHILDSLAALPLLPPSARICDIGTGAGFPGLPLLIARPELQADLLDSRGKKIQFLKECVRTLKLENVRPIQTRMEDYRPDVKYERIVSRAAFSSDNWILNVQHWLSHNGAILLWRSFRDPQTGFSHASKSASYREPAPSAEIFEKLNWSVRRHCYKIGPLSQRVIEEWRPPQKDATE